MVSRVLQAVYKEVRGLHQAAYVLALFTFGAQILALVRDRMLAHEFGADSALDLYYAAFRIPDLLYVLFASTLSVYVLIPFVAGRIDARGSERARKFLSEIFTLFLIVYALFALVVALFTPELIALVFPGFVGEQSELALLIRILLIQPFLLGVSSLLGVITQLGHRFVLYALSPVVYNAGIIGGLIFLYPHFGLQGLVWGVIIGALLHLAIQIPLVLKSEIAPHITFTISWSEMKDVLFVSVPRALTLSLHQIVLLGLVGFASMMSAGSVSVFQFAFNMQSVPLAIVGVSYSVAAFPALAQLYAEHKFKEFSTHILTALRHIIFWSIPIITLIIVIRAQFVRVVLGTGAFDWDDTRLTAAVLAIFVVSMLAQGINLLIVRALYAAGNTKLPLYTTLISSVGICVLTYILSVFYYTSPAFARGLEVLMRLEGVPGTEVLVLPLGYTIVLIFHSVILLILASRTLKFSLRVIWTHLLKACMAGAFAAIAAYATLNFFVDGLRTETLIGIFLQGLLAGSLGIAAAIFAYYIARSEELHEIYKSFHKKIFKTDVVAPQDEDHLAV